MYGPRRRIIGTRYVDRLDCTLPNGAYSTGSAWLLVLECGHISICNAAMDYQSETHDDCMECKAHQAGNCHLTHAQPTEGRALYVCTDGGEVGNERWMTEDEARRANEHADRASDGQWFWARKS